MMSLFTSAVPEGRNGAVAESDRLMVAELLVACIPHLTSGSQISLVIERRPDGELVSASCKLLGDRTSMVIKPGDPAPWWLVTSNSTASRLLDTFWSASEVVIPTDIVIECGSASESFGYVWRSMRFYLTAWFERDGRFRRWANICGSINNSASCPKALYEALQWRSLKAFPRELLFTQRR
jgi:hypothetical protein